MKRSAFRAGITTETGTVILSFANRLLLARHIQVQLNHNAIANQIISLPRVDDSKVFSIDRKLRVDSHITRSHIYGRRKRDRLLYSMQIKIAGHVECLRAAT